MPMSIAALSALAVAGVTAASSPVFIRDARTSWDGETFVFAVEGEAGFGGRSVEPSLLGRILVLAIDDTRVHESNRKWQGGAVKAHRHDYHTELSTALPADAKCEGPIKVTRTDDGGLRAAMACTGEPAAAAAAAGAAAATMPVAVADAAAVGKASNLAVATVKAQAARKEGSVTASVNEAKLRAAVALAAVKPVAPPPAAAVPPKAVSESPKPLQPTVAAKPAARVSSASAAKLAEPAAPVSVAQSVATVAPAGKPAAAPPSRPTTLATDRASDLQTVAVPLVALLLLSGVAFWRRRSRPGRGRVVRIVETASLGPKRSLIVAEVGGQRLVLGASEAGITLLESGALAAAPALGAATTLSSADRPSPSVAAAAPSASPSEQSDDLGEITVEEPEPAGQANVLTRLFSSKRRPAPESFARLLRSAQAPSPIDDFEDSVEDRELRSKLAAGIPVVTRGGRAA